MAARRSKGVDIYRGIRAGDTRKKTQGVHQRKATTARRKSPSRRK